MEDGYEIERIVISTKADAEAMAEALAGTGNVKIKQVTIEDIHNSLTEIRVFARHIAEGVHKLYCSYHDWECVPDDPEEVLIKARTCKSCGTREGYDRDHYVSLFHFSDDLMNTVIQLSVASGYCGRPISLVFDKGFVAVFSATRQDEDDEDDEKASARARAKKQNEILEGYV